MARLETLTRLILAGVFAVGLLLTQPVSAQGSGSGVLFDGDALWRFTINQELADFRGIPGGLDFVARQWFWVRAGSETSETVLPGPDFFSYILNVATLTWVFDDYELEVVLTLDDDPFEVAAATATEQVTVTNTSTDPLTVDLYTLAQFQTAGTTGLMVDLAGPDYVRAINGENRLFWAAPPGGDFQAFPSYTALLAEMDDDEPTELDGSGLPGAFGTPILWNHSLSLPVGTSQTLEFTYAIDPPSCPTGVEDLVCEADCALGTLDVSWTNTGAYGELEVVVDGVATVLDGSATSFTTPLTSASPTVTVLPFCEGLSVPDPATCTVDFRVTDLTCERNTDGDLVATWNNAGGYDFIEVSVDGLAQTVAGDETTLAMPVGSGNHLIEVTPFCGGFAAVTESCQVLGFSHVVWSAEGVDALDSTLTVMAGLDAIGQSYHLLEVDELLGFAPLLDPTSTLWVLNGTFPFDHDMSALEEDIIVSHILAGGSVYLEGADLWGFQNHPVLWNADGVDQATAENGADDFATIEGVDAGPVSLSDLTGTGYLGVPTDDSTDRIDASTTDLLGGDAVVVWRELNLGYPTGVFYDTDAPFGDVWSQSWEIAGFQGDTSDLVSRIVAALGGPGPVVNQFERGDANGDGGFNIADAVFILNHLFIADSNSPPCDDAADLNDDGTIDIADTIYALGALHIPGSPPPPSPFPACGSDSTFDGLSCATSSCR